MYLSIWCGSSLGKVEEQLAVCEQSKDENFSDHSNYSHDIRRHYKSIQLCIFQAKTRFVFLVHSSIYILVPYIWIYGLLDYTKMVEILAGG